MQPPAEFRATSDRQLLMDLAGADPKHALAELLRRHGRMVQRTARRITQDEHLAEDVCQAVFLVLLRKAGRLDAVESLGAWLHRVAVLGARKKVQAEARRKLREEKAAMTAHDPRPARLPTGLDAAINRLPAVYRQVIVAHYLEGASYQVIAAREGIAEKTVGSRCSRALERLRRWLAPGTAAAVLSQLLSAEASAATAAPLSAAEVGVIQSAVLGGGTGGVPALAAAIESGLWWAKAKVAAAVGSVSAALTAGAVVVVLSLPTSPAIWLSAGDAVLVAPMQRDARYAASTDQDPDADALSAQLLYGNVDTLKLRPSFHTVPNLDLGGYVTYPVEIPRAGTWYAWGRFYYPGNPNDPTNMNSFWIRVDDRPELIFGNLVKEPDGRSYYQRWHWDGGDGDPRNRTDRQNGGLPRRLSLGHLEAGRHTIRVRNRDCGEDRAPFFASPRIDVLCLTDDPDYVPKDDDVPQSVRGR